LEECCKKWLKSGINVAPTLEDLGDEDAKSDDDGYQTKPVTGFCLKAWFCCRLVPSPISSCSSSLDKKEMCINSSFPLPGGKKHLQFYG